MWLKKPTQNLCMNDLSKFCVRICAGAAGYVGTELTKQLLNKGYTVRAVFHFLPFNFGAFFITIQDVGLHVQAVEGLEGPPFEDFVSYICRR